VIGQLQIDLQFSNGYEAKKRPQTVWMCLQKQKPLPFLATFIQVVAGQYTD
jgi:hypothetical protein